MMFISSTLLPGARYCQFSWHASNSPTSLCVGPAPQQARAGPRGVLLPAWPGSATLHVHFIVVIQSSIIMWKVGLDGRVQSLQYWAPQEEARHGCAFSRRGRRSRSRRNLCAEKLTMAQPRSSNIASKCLVFTQTPSSLPGSHFTSGIRLINDLRVRNRDPRGGA